MEGGVLHLMDKELQDAVKKLMRRAFAPRFKRLVENAEKKSLQNNEDGCVMHSCVSMSVCLLKARRTLLTISLHCIVRA